MADPDTETVLARFRDRVAQDEGGTERGPDRKKGRAAFLQSAAVQHLFRLDELEPAMPGFKKGSAATYILEDTIPVVGRSGEGVRTLSPEARREGLRKLGGPDAIRGAIRRNRATFRTDVQDLLDRWANRQIPDPAAMTAAQLRAALILTEWNLPDFIHRGALERAQRRRTLVADFEVLAEGFVGRRAELEQLRSFIGASPGSLFERARQFVFGRSVAPLILTGIGGVGKTALVARFILDFFEHEKAGCFPFLYLAFDNKAIDPAEPHTIIAAALRQLETQLQSKAGPSERQVGEVREQLGRYLEQRERLSGRAVAERGQRARIEGLLERDQKLFRSFAEVLDRWSAKAGKSGGAERLPLLFILDTFEEVEYRPDSDLERFWKFVDTLCEFVPELRLLVVGRNMPASAYLASRKPSHLALGDLPQSDAISLLEKLGVKDRSLAASIGSQIGTNPLTLRLAGRLLQDTEGAAEIGSLRTHRFGLFRLGQEVIRGQLYRRVLDHIHDPEVRILAHPGMVLRRVTKDVVQQVLARACNMGRLSDEGAERLFDGLASEHSLVHRDETGALVYREEVRRPMLALLQADRPATTEEIHRAAAHYYGNRPDEISRAEEIYHLLMVGDIDRRYLRSRWTDALAQRLVGSVDEIPPAGRAWLASMDRIRASEEDQAAATREDQERILTHEVLRAFRIGAFAQAASFLDSAQIRPDSILGVLHVRALIATAALDQAERAIRRYLAEFPPLGSQARLAEFLWLAAQLAAQRGSPDEAAELLRHLVPVAGGFPSRLPLVQTLTELLLFARPEEAASSRASLARALSMLHPGESDREASLIRLALARLGAGWPRPWRLFGAPSAYDLIERSSEWPRETIKRVGAEIGELLTPDLPKRLLEAYTIITYASTETGIGSAIRLVASVLLDSAEGTRAERAAILVLQVLFQAEDTSLSASTLAGIEEEEDWWLQHSALEAAR